MIECCTRSAKRARFASAASDRVAHALREERTVGEPRHVVMERLMGELLLERLALADVAAVQDDAAHVLVLEEVGVLYLELKPGPVPVTEAAFDHVGLGTSARIRVPHTRQNLR